MAINWTVRGITYTSGQTFSARAKGTWYGSADGGQGSGTIPSGATIEFYGDYTGTAEWYYHPFLIRSDAFNGGEMCWTDIGVFPYATYTVNFNANGGTGAPSAQTKTWNSTLTLSSQKPTRASTSLAGYTVNFNGNGGTAAESSKTASRQRNYSFNKWTTQSGGGGTSYSAGGSYTANAGATLYAQWTSTDKTNPITLPNATRAGYTFDGWYTAASGGTRIGGAGTSWTPSGSTTLYAHWTANFSEITSAANGTLGSACSIKWTPSASSFTFKLKFSLGSWSYTTGTISPARTSEYTYTGYTYDYEIANQLPNSASGVLTVTLETYSGSTLLGSSTKTITITVPQNSTTKPTLSVTLSEGTASGFGVYATKLSTLKAVLETAGKLSATVKTAVMTFEENSYSKNVSNDAATITSNTIQNAASANAVSITITDSRGFTNTWTGSITTYDWFAPSVNGLEIDISGTTVTVSIPYSIASVNNLNTKKITLKRTRVSDEQQTTLLNGATLTDYIGTRTHIDTVSDIDTETYLYEVFVTDLKGNSATFSRQTGIICISRLAGGKGVTFFGEASQEGFHIIQSGTDEDYTASASDWNDLETWYNAN